jgi:glycosyltransferase involved in cell wall biosynthesis
MTFPAIAAKPAPQLLLMAYECNPTRGSEWAVGWGRLQQAARTGLPIHVITSAESYAATLRCAATHPLPPNVRLYHPDESDPLLRLLRAAVPRLFAYNYLAYHRWQKLAFRLAARLHAEHTFALCHQINVCTFREPGYGWRLEIPFLWGPVGGSQNFPTAFLRGLPPVEAFKEFMRTATNWLALRKFRVRRAAREATLLLGANSTNQRDYQRVFHREVGLLLETGLDQVHSPDRAKFSEPAGDSRQTGLNSPIRLLWSGEFTTRKALPLVLDALAALGPGVPFELRILGKGPLEAKWRRQAEQLGIAKHVRFLGHLPLADAIAQLAWAQLFVFTSLRDTSGNVVLEALSYGVPVLCFDHQGVADIVDSSSGIKIAVTRPAQAIADLAAAIRALHGDRDRLLRLSHGATARAQQFLWSANGDRINAVYHQLIAAARPSQENA